MNKNKPENTVANFSLLSDSNTECALIVQNHLVEVLGNEDSYFEWELISKIMTIGYDIREPFINLLRKASERNMQIIANAPIGNWIREYNMKFPLATRNPDSFFEFAATDPRTRNMNDKDRISLMRVLRIYDYLLISPPFDIEDNAVSAILKYRLSSEKPLLEIKKEIMNSIYDHSEDRIVTSRISLTKKIGLRAALPQFPKIGEQTITSSSLNIKHFDRPVLPSIKNWLYDYTSLLGQGPHDSMQRTNYLFRSENTKNLSSPEREKLGIILKSFDENTPLLVDPENNEIVFDISEKSTAPQKPFPPGGVMTERPMFNNQRTPMQSKLATEQAMSNDQYRRTTPANRTADNKAFSQPQKQASESFIKLYPPISRSAGNAAGRSATMAKPQITPRPTENKMRDTRYLPRRQAGEIPASPTGGRDTNKMQYVNPYPAPGTHRIEPSTEMAGAAPVKLKGFSEGLSKPAEPPTARKSQPPKPEFRPEPPKPYVPRHPKNIIYPHSGPQREEKAEPRIKGNIVDLSGEK